MKRIFYIFCAIVGILFFNGCTTPKTSISEQMYYAGDYIGAATVWSDKERQNTSSKGVLDNLYMGAANFTAGNFVDAIAALSRAEKGVEEQDHSLNWGSAYVGRTYDGIMMDTYLAVSFMAINDPDRARVAFNRLEHRLGMASERSKKAIAKQREEIEQARNDPDNSDAIGYVDKIGANASNQDKIEAYKRLANQWEAYADYENPVSRFLSGVFRMLYAYDNSDLEKALFQMKACYGMTNSEAARVGMELAQAMITGSLEGEGSYSRDDFNDMMVVIFENGYGVTKEEVRIDLFIPLKSPIYAGIALPKLVERSEAYTNLALWDDTTFLGQTLPLCSMDRIVATEFRSELPGLIASEITKCVIKVVLQALVAEAVKEASNNNLAVQLITGMAGSLVAYAITNADIRHWNFLPKNFQATWVPKPKSGVLSIAVPNGPARIVDVKIPECGPALVYIKIPEAGKPPLCMLITP